MYGIEGDSIIAFPSADVDVHFFRDRYPERSEYYVMHFFVELFDITKSEMILCQYLLADWVIQTIGQKYTREGAYIQLNRQNVSVSQSWHRPASGLFYLGVPIIEVPPDHAKNPLSALHKQAWYDEIKLLAIDIMQSFTKDFTAVKRAKLELE
jgi:hypothetical protein